MVGRVHGVERRAAAELLADRPEQVHVRQLVARPAEEEHGTVTAARWSARFVSGLPGWWSGKEKKTSPRTPSSGDSEAAVDVMRPPKEWPPARSGRSGAASCAAATAERTVSVQTACESRPLPCSA